MVVKTLYKAVFFFQAEDGIRDGHVTGVQTCALPIYFGGLAELASRIPIKQYIDHGPNVQPTPAVDEFLQKTYPQLYGKATHTVVKPGDKIPMAGLDWRVVAAAGQVLNTPLPGAGRQNPYCASTKAQDPDPTENAQSV